MSISEPPSRSYSFGEFVLRTDERMLMRSGHRVHLTPRLFELLKILVENAGRLVTKETLLAEIWRDSFVEEGNLNNAVSRLRKTLGEKGDQKGFIETVPRVGYRFTADVEIASENELSLASEPRQLRQTSRLLPLAFAGIALAVLSIVFLLLYLPGRFGAQGVSPAPKNTLTRLTTDESHQNRPYLTVNGKIRFTRSEGNRAVSYVMNPDGSEIKREVSIPNLQWGLWSPDEKKVAFLKENDESGSFYLANSDGTGEVKLPFTSGNLDWSSDSGKIVFQSGRPNADIFLYTLEGGKVEPIVSSPSFDSDPAFSPDGNQIAFVSDRDGNFEIYIQNLDGSGLRRLTDHPAHDSFPSFSPDGTQIAFNSDREFDTFDVYLMDLEGGGLRRLTNQRSNEMISPGCWSSDGTVLYMLSDQGNGKDNIFAMNVEPFMPTEVFGDPGHDVHLPVYSPDSKKIYYVAGGEKSGELAVIDMETKRTTTLWQSEDLAVFPAVSPDGQSIVFQSRVDGNIEICVINSDGTNFRNLTANPSRDTMPAWSPDGQHIVFTSNRDGNYDLTQLYVMNADGTNQHRIYFSNAMSQRPSWSPDGRQIIFANDKQDGRTGNFEIFSIEPETTQPEKQLTFHRRYDVAPVFSPNGDRIAFVSNADGNSEIYMMRSDGSGRIRLTRDTAEDTEPSWSPDGKRIIFSSNRTGRFALYELNVD